MTIQLTREFAQDAVERYGFGGKDKAHAVLLQSRGAVESARRGASIPGSDTVCLVIAQDQDSSELWFACAFCGPRQVQYAEAWSAMALADLTDGKGYKIDRALPTSVTGKNVLYRVCVVPAVNVAEFDLNDVAWKHHIVDTLQTAYPTSFTGEGSKDLATEEALEKEMKAKGLL